MTDVHPGVVVCVDFGSTFTKASLVDLAEGRLVASASHPTTLPRADGSGDVLDGYDACRAALVEQDPRAADAEVLACSSAGGGLRIAVLGNEELGGNRPRTPLRPQQEVTGLDRIVPYMITEYGGHMYPTKSNDHEQRQAHHAAEQ